MIDAFSRVARASDSQEFMWHCIEPLVVALFDEPSTPSLDRIITLVSPYLDWDERYFNQNKVTRWSAAALATLALPCTEEVGRSVVDTLWRIAPVDTLRQHIPVSIWLRSNTQTSLPLGWPRGRLRLQRAVRQVRALGNIEIFKSYLFLIWLGQDWFTLPAFTKICVSIREDFGGIGMVHHREDLMIRLDVILRRLDQRLGRLDPVPEPLVRVFRPLARVLAPLVPRFESLAPRFEPLAQRLWRLDQRSGHPYFAPGRVARIQYMDLKQLLLEMDRETTEILTRKRSRFAISFDLFTSVDTHRISLDVQV